jgi:hypothetical protein
MRLCWADKIPLLLFGLITVALLVLGELGPTDSDYCRYLRLEHPDWTSANSYCFVTSAQHWSAFFSIEWILFLKFIAPIWVITRLIDLFAGGPAIRREYCERMRVSAPRRMVDIDVAPREWRREEPDWRRQLRRQV